MLCYIAQQLWMKIMDISMTLRSLNANYPYFLCKYPDRTTYGYASRLKLIEGRRGLQPRSYILLGLLRRHE